MPTTTVEITEPAKNIVEVNVSNVVVEEIQVPATSVEIIEQINEVAVAAVTRALGASSLSSPLTVTNGLGDALDGLTFPAGTSLETLIRNIISPFNEPTISSVAWTADGVNQTDGEDLLLEVGYAATIRFIDLTFTDAHNLDNDVDLVMTDTTANPPHVFADIPVNDYADLPTPARFKAFYTIPISNYRQTRNIEISTGYRGDNGTSEDVVALTKTAQVHYRDRFYVVAGPATVGQSSLDDFIAGSQNVMNTLAVDFDNVPQEISVSCNIATRNPNNFTWILVPFPGVLGTIYAEVGGGSVIDYTDSFTTFTSGQQLYSRTAGTASPRYTAYRSNQPGAFDSDVTLKITLTRFTR